MAKALGDCQFDSEPNGKGYYVGVCAEFPALRGRPRKSRLDAIDDIVALVADKLRDIDANGPKQRGER